MVAELAATTAMAVHLHGGEVWERVGDRGRAARDLQPAVDVLQVDAHGSFRHTESTRDLGIGVPGGDLVQQFPLPRGQLMSGAAAPSGGRESCVNEIAFRPLSTAKNATASQRIWPIRSVTSDHGSPASGMSPRSSPTIPSRVRRSFSLTVTGATGGFNRPRKTLGFMKPSEKLAELLAHTG